MDKHSSSERAPGRLKPFCRQDWLIAVALATVVVVGGSSRMLTEVTGLWHDDAIYIVTAQSLADGDGYRIANLPNAPNQTKYPLLFPSVLALIWFFLPTFPDNLWVMQGICLLSCAGAVALGYLYVVRFRYAPRRIAAAAGLLCATSPMFLFFSTQIMTEMPFALLLIISFWSIDRSLTAEPRGRAHQIGLGLLLTLPFWCRAIGLIFVPCGLLLIRRAGRPLRWSATGAVASVLLWVTWVLLGTAGQPPDQVSVYYTDYLAWWSSLGLPQLAHVVSKNIGTLFAANTELGLEGVYGLLSELAMRRSLLPCCVAAYLVLLSFGAFAFNPFLRHLREGRMLPCCITGYLLLISFWPWPPDRFLVPVLPMLVVYLLLGASWFMHRFLTAHARYVGLVAICFAVTANATFLARYSRLSHEIGSPVNDSAGNPAYWHSYVRLFDWIRNHTPEEAVVATDKDPMFYLYSGRRAFRPFLHQPGPLFYGLEGPRLGTVEEFAHTLRVRQAAYVVVTPMEFYDQPFAQLTDQLQELKPEWVRRVYQDPTDPRFEVFELGNPGSERPTHSASSRDHADRRAILLKDLSS